MCARIDQFLYGNGAMPSDDIILKNQDYINQLTSQSHDYETRRRLLLLIGRLHELQGGRAQRSPYHGQMGQMRFKKSKSKKSKKKSTRKRRSIKKRKSGPKRK